jgi:hypothetical protein
MRVGAALFAGCIAAFVLVVAAPARVDDASTLKAEFLRDYPRALEKLEARFLRVRGVAKYKDERHLINTRGEDIGVTAIDNSTLEFECKLPSLVRVLETGEEAMIKGDTTKSTNHWRVRGSNDDYLFELRIPANGKISVTSLLSSKEVKFKDEQRYVADKLLRYLGAPFYLDVFPMSGFLTAKNVSIRSVSRVRVGTRDMLKAEFEMRPLPNQKGARSREGWFTVSPGEAWVLHEYEYDHGDISRHGSIEYGGMQGGLPELRRFTHKVSKLGTHLNTQTYDFEKLDFADVPDRDFTLSAFGLPEVGGPAGKRSGAP